MRLMWLGTAGALFLGTTAWAAAPPQQGDPPKAGQEQKGDLASLRKNFTDAKKAYTDSQKKFREVIADLQKKGEKLSLESSKELREAYAAQNQAQQKVMAAALAFAKADPASADGFDAISYAVNFGGGTEMLKLLTKYHVANPKVGSLLGRLPTYTPAMLKETEPFLRAVIEKNPSKEAKGQAMFALAQALMRSNKDEAEKLFEKLAADYGDVKAYRGTLAKAAEANLFELRHLQVGMVAPDIAGEDFEGKKFKLSDYRGKVVMLDFWGHW